MRRSNPFIALLGILALILALAARCAQQPQQPNPHPHRASSNREPRNHSHKPPLSLGD